MSLSLGKVITNNLSSLPTSKTMNMLNNNKSTVPTSFNPSVILNKNISSKKRGCQDPNSRNSNNARNRRNTRNHGDCCSKVDSGFVNKVSSNVHELDFVNNIADKNIKKLAVTNTSEYLSSPITTAKQRTSICKTNSKNKPNSVIPCNNAFSGINLPELNLPTLPHIHLPHFSLPHIDLPNIDLPDMSLLKNIEGDVGKIAGIVGKGLTSVATMLSSCGKSPVIATASSLLTASGVTNSMLSKTILKSTLVSNKLDAMTAFKFTDKNSSLKNSLSEIIKSTPNNNIKLNTNMVSNTNNSDVIIDKTNDLIGLTNSIKNDDVIKASNNVAINNTDINNNTINNSNKIKVLGNKVNKPDDGLNEYLANKNNSRTIIVTYDNITAHLTEDELNFYNSILRDPTLTATEIHDRKVAYLNFINSKAA